MPIIGILASANKSVSNAPTIGTATNVGTGRAFNNGAATVAFTAPSFNGKSPITSYTATSSPGGFTASGAGSPLTVAGLQSSTAYTFTVTATNAVGISAASAASNSITATTVPQAPTIGTASDGGTGTTATVAFTGNATGGSAITTYTATSSPGGLTGTSASSPITVSGLTTGTAYTFTVTATNANGTSTSSAASNSVTPASPTSFDSIATFTPNGISTVTFSSIPQTYKNLQLRMSVIGSALFSSVQVRVNGVSAGYTVHYMFGNGTTTSASALTATSRFAILDLGIQGDPSFPTVGILDIIDYASTSKNKTGRMFGGIDKNGSGEIVLESGLYQSTTAISSIEVFMVGGQNYVTGTSIALYGTK